MAYLTYTQDPIGSFVEKDTGNTFEFSWNKDKLVGEAFWDYGNLPHKVWVASGQIGGFGLACGVVKRPGHIVVWPRRISDTPIGHGAFCICINCPLKTRYGFLMIIAEQPV